MGETVDSTLEITIEFSEEEAEQIFSNAIKDFILKKNRQKYWQNL